MGFFTKMKFSFLSRLAAWRGNRRRAERQKFIFLYHRIAAPQYDPFALALPESSFQDHLNILRSYCRLVTLDEILSAGRSRHARLASITFDDGYVDNLLTASPILRLAEIPATFFISTSCLGDVRGFWWDRLASAIAAADDLSCTFELMKGLPLTGHLSSPDSRRKATLEIAHRLQRMHSAARDQTVTALENVLLAGASRERELCPVLDEAGVRELGSHPLAHLGAHTHTHAMLSLLPREAQLAEISRSATTLANITGRRPRFVAYPYGSEGDYNTDSYRAAKDAGLEAAFVNHACRFDPKSLPFRIPRYYVPPLSADHFRRWLLGILGA